MTSNEHDNDTSSVDRSIVAAQIGREPRALKRIAVRCVHGFPAVTEQQPTDEQGRPFPTAYYVTCPHLVRNIDRIESSGGVRRFEALNAQDQSLRASTLSASKRHALIGERGTAIAAASDPERLKCLHAHAGFELAAHDHPLGAKILEEASPRWCTDARCAGFLDESAKETP